MKIGILTFHRAHNYGAVLQAYALLKYLKSIGHDSEFIDYRPKYIEFPYRLWPDFKQEHSTYIKKLREFVLSVLYLCPRISRRLGFNRFIRRHLKMSPEIPQNLDAFTGEYDACFFGSDQIWNPKICNGFDAMYFGQFKTKPGCLKVAYAASMEAKTLKADEKKFYTAALDGFQSISVRETELKSLLQPITNKNIHTVLDPTLLLAPEMYDDIYVPPRIKDRYVLIYEVFNAENTEAIAKSIANELCAKVIRVASSISWRSLRTTIYNASPGEFLGLVKNAECVVTSSFHGVAISLLYGRPFYSVVLEGHGSRVSSLLSDIGLSSRIITIPPSHFSKIDGSDTFEKLNQKRLESIAFINSSLS